MKKLIVLILIAVYMLGCSKQEQSETRIDPRLEPLVSEYIAIIEAAWPEGLIVEFGAASDKNANCTGIGTKQRIIKVNLSRFYAFGPEQQRGIIFHELGHCILGLMHVEGVISYMLPAIQTEAFYVNNKLQLMENLLWIQ